MSNEFTRDHFAQSTQTVPMRSRRLTAARKATASVFLCFLMIFGAACDDDGSDDGSGGKKSAQAKLETKPVDLPPGQTEAVLAWEPSVGPVTGYLVFASRNGSTFEFELNTRGPNATIPGRAGDELRIVVVALSENGSLSDTSPPSAPVRFYPETVEPEAVAATESLFDRAASLVALATGTGPNIGPNAGTAGADAPSSAAAETQTVETQVAAQAAPSNTPAASTNGRDSLSAAGALPAAGASQTAGALQLAGAAPIVEALRVAEAQTVRAAPERMDSAEAEQNDREFETAETARRTALLERLLSSDARLAPRGRSNAADAWVQSFVDEELAAGVTFVGTGNANDDGLRELIWQDASGQLFVSDGESFLNSEDSADTLEEALRLQSSERFVAFEDLDGDAGSEWLIEDTLMGRVYILRADASSTRDATPLNENSENLRLVGLGDFDGDDRSDLLWRKIDGASVALAIGTEETEWIPALDAEIWLPEDRRTDIPLAIADLNGDGRDDLLSRDRDGRLRMTLFVASEKLSSPGAFEAFWAGGADASAIGLYLVGTLDLDRDGDAEIAWIDEDGLQIWDASQGPVDLPEF